MDDTLQRLTKCFTAVFAGLAEQDAPLASTSSLARWESVNHVLLLSVVSEEFDIEFEPEEYELLTSFALIAASVKEKRNHA